MTSVRTHRFIGLSLAAAVLLGCNFMGQGGNSGSSTSSAASSAGNDLIQVESPKSNAVVGSTFIVEGRARGQWYFEATFPVLLYADDGTLLVSTYAEAQGEWMTTEFVPFRANVAADTTGHAGGTLVLQKSNPSGLPEHDQEIHISVRFAEAPNPQ